MNYALGDGELKLAQLIWSKYDPVDCRRTVFGFGGRRFSGKNNPGGRLPVTFYTGVEQLPPFEDYSMNGRTYRYFKGKPLYPFGYGLSYTTFSYNDLRLSKNAIKAGDPLTVEVTMTNTGKRDGDEVAQVYLSFPNVAGAPLRALRAFKRIHLKAGEAQKLRFELKERDLSMVSELPFLLSKKPMRSTSHTKLDHSQTRPGICSATTQASTECRIPYWTAETEWKY